MKQLTSTQRDLVANLARRLGEVLGIRAVVLGGSHARGRAHPDSDIDLGLYYSEAAPFAIDAVRRVAEAVNDTPSPIVTDFHQWGPWVNGGAWLTIDGQRVDFVYRSFQQMDRAVTDAEAGRYEVHHLQQPPFGFFSGVYLGELQVCMPLTGENPTLTALKERVATYPERLRAALLRDYLFMAEFNLTAFASKVAARGDVFGTAACLARAVHELAMVIFAVHRRYPVNDKTLLAEIAELPHAPRDFASRAQCILAHLGDDAVALSKAVADVTQLLAETKPFAHT